MNNLQKGEIITLDNNKEYICVSNIKEEDKNYVFLMSNFKPLDIKIGEEINEDGHIKIKFIADPKLKEYLISKFKEDSEKIIN